MKKGWRIGLRAASAVHAVLWAVLLVTALVQYTAALSAYQPPPGASGMELSPDFEYSVGAMLSASGMYSAALLCVCLFLLPLFSGVPLGPPERAALFVSVSVNVLLYLFLITVSVSYNSRMLKAVLPAWLVFAAVCPVLLDVVVVRRCQKSRAAKREGMS